MRHFALVTAAFVLATTGSLVSAAATANAPASNAVARTSPAGNYLAGRFAGATRDMAAASTYYRAALRADPKNEELVERTFLAVLATGDVEQAIPFARRLIALDRSQRVARLAIASRALKRGRYSVARAQLSHSVRGPIADLTSTLLSAWALAGSGKTKSAVAAIDRLHGPDWYVAFKDLHAGLIYEYAHRKKQAGKRLERAYHLDATAIRTADAYARWLSESGDRAGAKKVYETFSKAFPGHPLIESALAELKAGKTLAPMVRTPAAGAAEALFGLGTALGNQGGEDIGLVYLQLAIYLDPGHPLALVSLANLYETMKKPELAVDIYDRISANSPLKRSTDIQRALDLEVMKKHDEAKKELTRLVEQDAKDPQAIIALGNVLRSRKQYKEAAATYSKAIALIKEPTRRNWSLFYFRGMCNERAKDWPDAEKDLEKALELYPDQPSVLNYLGYSWVDRGVHLDKAVKMIRRAVELKPNDGYIVDSLGWAQYKLGHYQEASDALERAIELKPEDPVINDHLGDIYWKVGRELEARFQWRHARDNKPEAEDLVKIEEKLKNGLQDGKPSKAGAVETPGKGG